MISIWNNTKGLRRVLTNVWSYAKSAPYSLSNNLRIKKLPSVQVRIFMDKTLQWTYGRSVSNQQCNQELQKSTPDVSKRRIEPSQTKRGSRLGFSHSLLLYQSPLLPPFPAAAAFFLRISSSPLMMLRLMLLPAPTGPDLMATGPVGAAVWCCPGLIGLAKNREEEALDHR